MAKEGVSRSDRAKNRYGGGDHEREAPPQKSVDHPAEPEGQKATNAGSGEMDLSSRHAMERKAMAIRHDAERRDLHMAHRAEHRDVEKRHEAEHAAMMQATEIAEDRRA